MYIKGLKFGMLLQFAIGPMCLLVFNTATSIGLFQALILVSSIALVDAIYIILAYFGISKFLENERTKFGLKIFGGLVLSVFGLNMILNTLGINFIPAMSMFSDSSQGNLFIKGCLLTASNPLTIIFWSGILTSQLVEHNIKGVMMFNYGLGLVSSTIFFLTAVALLGLGINQFLNPNIIVWLNVMVGAVIIAFGIKMLLKKQS